MDSFKMYLELMQERPELFRNTDEPGEIKIIKDPERILAEQKRIRAELRANGHPGHWIDIGVLSEDEWFWTVRDMVEFPGGFVWGYIRQIDRKVQDGGFGVILMCVKENQVLLIKRFRHEERGWSWEFPRGFGDPNKTAEENALNELEEELRVKDAHLELLAEIKNGNGGLCAYLVNILPSQEIRVDTREGISENRWISLDDLDKLVLQGRFSDWFSLWAYSLSKIVKQSKQSL
ncbi:MAG TPA: NUDIX domain-containing protein [Anaerolineales bacterium]|nr:NUDIX domain-containing protein [Anaerolineales bacterium]HLO30121.1 NUDIX domain-containing protein [Anaerolineales bacterium]